MVPICYRISVVHWNHRKTFNGRVPLTEQFSNAEFRAVVEDLLGG